MNASLNSYAERSRAISSANSRTVRTTKVSVSNGEVENFAKAHDGTWRVSAVRSGLLAACDNTVLRNCTSRNTHGNLVTMALD